MPKNNIFLTLLIIIGFTSCTNLKDALYREGELTSDFGYPEDKKIKSSLYLLGDGGYSKPGGTSQGLIALEIYLDSVKQEGNYTIFLGDNIYPDGMEKEGHPLRERGEYRIDAQLEAVENYDGQVIFIPGNHDWYNEGLDGLQRQRNYIVSKLNDETAFAPEPGCPLKSIEVSDDVQLLVVDSQWYLVDWDQHPLINKDCSIKTRESLFLALENELELHQDKVVVFAIHHPLYTNGVHGGAYNFNTHLYPSQKKMPVPILGSIVMLARTSGGVSSADIQNLRYKTLINRLETLVSERGNVVFVSGHEHSLQYIEKEGIKQIVSGSGSKATYVTLGTDGLFAFEGQGFVVLDIFEDGSTWASYYGSIDYHPKLLYQKEIVAAPRVLLSEDISGKSYDKIGAASNEGSIEARMVDLDTLFGGLKAVQPEGRIAGAILRLEDSRGRIYRMKSPGKFERSGRNRKLDKDLKSAKPFLGLVLPELSKAAGIAYTSPRLFYVPKQDALGPYNKNFGDALYIIEERPEGDWTGHFPFGGPKAEMHSALDIFERIRAEQDFAIDESAYVRARVFDMLIGDWNNAQQKWSWAPFEDELGNQVFRPIPRDRDQAFSDFDGQLAITSRGMTGIVNEFAIYEDDINDLKEFNSAALGLDRTLLQNMERQDWLKEAQLLQEKITDRVIEKAFSHLPTEIQNGASAELMQALKARRDDLVDIARRYYEILSEYAIVTGTDKDDYLTVERMSGGRTKVTVNRITDGKEEGLISSKVYDPQFTKEIWIYGLHQEDKFIVSGDDKAEILVRLIGGHGRDVYDVQQGKKVKIYDYKSFPSIIKARNGANLELTDDYEINVFDRDRKIYSTLTAMPAVGFNPDDEFTLGVDVDFTRYRFRRNPFTSQHGLSAIYHSATNGFKLDYDGEFANSWGDFNFAVGASFTSPNFSENFFGFGNETRYEEGSAGMDYHRVQVSRIGVETGFVKRSPFGRFLKLTASFEGIEVEPEENGFIGEEISPEKDFFKRKYFFGLNGTFRYASYDDVLNPTNGMRFNLHLGGKTQLEEPDQIFGFLESYLGFYKALSEDRKLVLNPRVEAKINFGDDFEFYQAAMLGGESGLRGYRNNRFSGESAFLTGTDLRYSLEEFETALVPLQVGVFAGYDLGRVWLDGENSNVWHDSYGGGIFLVGSRALTGKAGMFKGSEDWRFTFSMLLNF